MSLWLTREEAVAKLGIRAQSLYAYVTRGRLKAIPDPADPRRSLYSADDIAALGRKRQRGRATRAIATGSLAWGEPVMDTAISTVAHGALWYRGRSAVALAADGTFEDAFELLLGIPPLPAHDLQMGSGVPDLFVALAGRAARGRPTFGRATASLAREAAALLPVVSAALGADPALPSLHLGFATAWQRQGAADVIRRALVLLADHELNPSTFAVRVAASTGAPLAACLLSGLSTLAGPLHGAATVATRSFVNEATRLGAAVAVAARVSHGAPVPGFGHPLYARVDVRAASLLEVLCLPPVIRELRDVVASETGLEPNIDFATVALAITHDLPPEAPMILFAAARTAGWLAHSVEQAVSGSLIRPRARYIGEPAG